MKGSASSWQGLEHRAAHKCYDEQVRELELFSLDKTRLRREFITLYNCLKGGCIRVEESLFSQAPSGRMKGYGLKLCQGRVRQDIRKNFFSKRMIKHSNSLEHGSS